MTDNSILRSWNGRTIRQRADGYFSLTDMATACEKQYSEWERLPKTKSYLEAYLERNSISENMGNTQLPIEIVKDGAMEGRGTWGNKRIALRFAQWCSDHFAIQVDIWIEELLTTGKVELTQPKPQTQAEMFLASAQLLVDIERRQLALEAENDKIKAELAEQKETAEVHELEIAANAAELERFKNGHGAWFSIIGYRKLKGLEPISTKQAANLGRKASALCKLNNINPEKITDPRFGTVGVYPDWILSEVVI